MTEPLPSIATGCIAGAGVSLCSVVLGAQLDALAVGLFAAFLSSIWLEVIDNRVKAAAAVLFSSLLAGYGAPSAAALATSMWPHIASSVDAVRLPLAFLIGAVGPRGV